VIQTLRDICSELRPMGLSHFGLGKAIRSHLLQLMGLHPDIRVEVDVFDDRHQLSERQRLALFRVYQNAISNIMRHAQASYVRVDFRIENEQVILKVQDDGRGFTLPQKWVELTRAGHFGLVGMAERVGSLGGQISVVTEDGCGTTVEVRMPLMPDSPNSG
jgi:signal transduction histidine kinase